MIHDGTKNLGPRHEGAFAVAAMFAIIIMFSHIAFNEPPMAIVVRVILLIALLASACIGLLPVDFLNTRIDMTPPTRKQRAALVMIVMLSTAALVFLFFPIRAPLQVVREWVLLVTIIGMAKIGLD